MTAFPTGLVPDLEQLDYQTNLIIRMPMPVQFQTNMSD